MAALRWGIISAGKISNDFCLAMRKCTQPNKIVAIAAHDFEKAKKFKEERPYVDENVKVYGSYDDLLEDPSVDVVYVGVVNHMHLEVVLKSLEHGKHVLCEKPMATNLAEAKQMIEKAREKNLFLMEGAWSRCFPVYKQLRKELENQYLGKVRSVFANKGDDNLADNRFRPDMGATPLNDIGCYALSFALWVFPGQFPTKITAVGKVQDGVDIWANITLEFADGGRAFVLYSADDKMPNSAFVSCENGHYELLGDEGTEMFDYDLNDDAEYNFRNSGGFRYEADHVYECLKDGKLESDLMTHKDTLRLTELIDEIKRQLGVEYKHDKKNDSKI